MIDNEVSRAWAESYGVIPGNTYTTEYPNETNHRNHNNTESLWVWISCPKGGDDGQIGLAEKYFYKAKPMMDPDFDLDEIHAAQSALAECKSRA